MTQHPLRPGLAKIVEAELEPTLRIRNFRAEREPLSKLEKHFVFWTPALPYRHGNLRHHHWHDLFRELGRELSFYRLHFPTPLLSCAIGFDTWDRVLWAVKRRDWPHIVEFVLSIAQHDPGKRLYERYGLQELVLPDPRAAGASTFTLQAFGLMTNECRMGFWQQGVGLPTARRFKPLPEMVQQEEALYRGHLTDQHASPNQEAA